MIEQKLKDPFFFSCLSLRASPRTPLGFPKIRFFSPSFSIFFFSPEFPQIVRIMGPP